MKNDQSQILGDGLDSEEARLKLVRQPHGEPDCGLSA